VRLHPLAQHPQVVVTRYVIEQAGDFDFLAAL